MVSTFFSSSLCTQPSVVMSYFLLDLIGCSSLNHCTDSRGFDTSHSNVTGVGNFVTLTSLRPRTNSMCSSENNSAVKYICVSPLFNIILCHHKYICLLPYETRDSRFENEHTNLLQLFCQFMRCSCLYNTDKLNLVWCTYVYISLEMATLDQLVSQWQIQRF